jgi:hypothetical protein
MLVERHSPIGSAQETLLVHGDCQPFAIIMFSFNTFARNMSKALSLWQGCPAGWLACGHVACLNTTKLAAQPNMKSPIPHDNVV